MRMTHVLTFTFYTATFGIVMTLPASEMDFSSNFRQTGEEESIAKKVDDVESVRRQVYKLRFMPLSSMLRSYLRSWVRRIVRRRGHRGRSNLSIELEDRDKCSLNHLGSWADSKNPCRFYECALNVTNIETCLQGLNKSMNDNKNNQQEGATIQNLNQFNKEFEESKASKSVRVDGCVFLVFHQCRESSVYSALKQACIPIDKVPQECLQ